MPAPVPDFAADIWKQLSQRSRADNVDFQLTLTRYGVERLLYRLSQCPYKKRFVLKGAMLFITWDGWSPRPTRDVDFLGRGPNSEAETKTVFQALCRQAAAADGLTFDPETVRVEEIREAQAYPGKSVRLLAMLGKTRIDLRVDIGFGDAVTPAPQSVAFPTLLDLPAPDILAYPRETVVAEKLEAMVRWSLTNGRMKDYYDLAQLARRSPRPLEPPSGAGARPSRPNCLRP